MSYHIDSGSSLERLIEYSVGVEAGLEAHEGLADHGTTWRNRRGVLRDLRDARDEARYAWVRAASKLKVIDVDWDAIVIDLSGRAYLAAGKDAAAEPYRTLFGSVKASDAVKLGPAKATAFGDRLVARATELGHADLAPTVGQLKAQNVALTTSGQARDAAREAALLHDLRRRKAIDELMTLIAETEVAILTAFPGRRDLVRAILAPTTPSRRSGSAEPDSPDVDDDPDAPEI
jgi:hypothetical protein